MRRDPVSEENSEKPYPVKDNLLNGETRYLKKKRYLF